MSCPKMMAIKALLRTGAGRFSFMSHWFCNLVGFRLRSEATTGRVGGRALPARVARAWALGKD
jgi:hypothetical protein